MGIYDRDYYRDGSGGWGGAGLKAVPALIAVTVGVFVVQLFSSSGKVDLDPLLRHGAFAAEKVLDGEVWRLVTAFFVTPYSIFGIVLTMLGLYWFGTELEEYYGTRRFLWFYLLAGTTVSAGQLALGAAGVEADGWTAGARGPLFAVLTLYAFHYPARQVLLLFVLPVPVGLLVAGLLALYVLLLASAGGPKLEIAAPLIGAAFGAAFFKLADSRFARSRGDDSRRGERARPKLTLRPADPPADDDQFAGSTPTPHRPRAARPDEYLEAKLDAVLEKMARSGRDSLTAEENAVLLKASEVYRQKGK